MFEPIPYADVPKNSLFIDVRSPSEYRHATIEGAINIPIFSDDERALIGTMYKQDSTDKAKQKGVDIVSVKLPRLFQEIVQLKRDSKRPVVLFCSRGGYRSGSLASFLNGMGERVFWLKNGYKGYRNYVLEQIDIYAQEKNFIVLHGNTGIGKTRILKGLQEKGIDVLDFEEGANHRGSILGSVGLGDPTSLKQFESYIYHRLTEFTSDYIIVEAESRRIGKVFIPMAIHEKMNNGIHVNLTADYEFRADILIEDYTSHLTFEADMAEGIRYLGKYIGEKRVQGYLDMMATGDIKNLAIDLMKNYYDPLYEHKADQIEYALTHHITSIDETVRVIEQWYRKLYMPVVDEILDDEQA